jgi:hypothetical protein
MARQCAAAGNALASIPQRRRWQGAHGTGACDPRLQQLHGGACWLPARARARACAHAVRLRMHIACMLEIRRAVFHGAHHSTSHAPLVPMQVLRSMGVQLCSCLLSQPWAFELFLVNMDTGAQEEPPASWWKRVVRCMGVSSEAVSAFSSNRGAHIAPGGPQLDALCASYAIRHLQSLQPLHRFQYGLLPGDSFCRPCCSCQLTVCAPATPAPHQAAVLLFLSDWWARTSARARSERAALCQRASAACGSMALRGALCARLQLLNSAYLTDVVALAVIAHTALLTPEQLAETYLSSWPHLPSASRIFRR